MKRLLRPVYCGVGYEFDESSGKYKFNLDFENNQDNDIIKFVEPYFKQSTIDRYTYWFGYGFNDGQEQERRNQFIEFMKHVQPINWSDPDDEWSDPVYTDDSITEPELSEMLFRSMNNIRISERDIDTIVYPESKSGNLVSMIVKLLRQAMPSKPRLEVHEVLKANPSNIQFDYEGFHDAVDSGQLRVPEFVTDEYIQEMMDKVHSGDSFSLRRCIKPVMLRPFVSGFYDHKGAERAISDSRVVLIVDDFGTSGTTIRELIRVIRKINDSCEIYIFTLMGNRRAK